ncbi:MAG: hypothetical protein RDV41_10215 [Planctomycetota bacterium]|nr:hypothetical protein [Planctomycetota bacterium]
MRIFLVAALVCLLASAVGCDKKTPAPSASNVGNATGTGGSGSVAAGGGG